MPFGTVSLILQRSPYVRRDGAIVAGYVGVERDKESLVTQEKPVDSLAKMSTTVRYGHRRKSRTIIV